MEARVVTISPFVAIQRRLDGRECQEPCLIGWTDTLPDIKGYKSRSAEMKHVDVEV